MKVNRCWAVGILTWITVAATQFAAPAFVGAQQAASPRTSNVEVFDRSSHQAMVGNAIEFLASQRNADGSYSPETGPAVTALVTTGMLRHGRSVDDPLVSRSLEYLESLVQPSGGVYRPSSLYQNYETCLAVMCFSSANQDGRYDQLLQNADSFLKSIQWDQGEGLESDDAGFGGAGYGSHNRPDLSNTSFLIEALHALGNDADSEAMQRALAFVSRRQNLDSPENPTPFAEKVQDGGFYYTAAAGGSSQAGTTANGGLRSYGSMTYAGLKSMIFAGVDASDARVKAALSWLGRHYALDTNPGMGDAGLYYYYHTLAKALDAMQTDLFEDQDGQKHRWRDELNAELLRRQRADGSWINENERWLEANPNLVTGYVLLALSYTRPQD